MVAITIDVDKLVKLTKKEYVLQHLYQKAAGARARGEASRGELYDGWVQACIQTGEKPGTGSSFRKSVYLLMSQGVIEVSRQEPEPGVPFPRNFYILTAEYYNYMRSR
jgi:hypothetical protein